MGIGLRATSSGDTSGSIPTLTKPTGFASTDILIAVWGTDRNTTGTVQVSGPTGWTAIATALKEADSSNSIFLSAFWALGSVASTTFTTGGSFQDFGYVCGAFTGVDNVTPIDIAGTAVGASGANSLSVGSITIATANAWHCIAAIDWNSGTFSATNFTVAVNGEVNASAALLYNQTPKSTGATGTVTLNDSASATNQLIAAMPFALRPSTSVFTKKGNTLTFF